ncbi:hypothetical protein FD755_024234 [Muntiacus reevesi]|uniref:G-protein coupled receptors family 1 profile domain-containing protein n=1 Tax=Muntiacus reevesi TaxID=9886 RepID=A0A5N3VAD5_MUNRE|nr:hypothetical protein FD755_024235 [Muntiacus reevesi]KAB0346121.1 hypothetical protein FD755_024234 [Muntiacus reevesi]
MGSFETNISSTTSFTLTGFPEMEGLEHWLAALLLLLHAVSILGNNLILFIIKEEQSLHQPMYYFLSLLSVNDLGVSFSTLPTILATLWFHAPETAFDACLIQIFDCYVGICNPLHYSTALTDTRVAHIGISIIIQSFCMVFPLPFLLKRLPFIMYGLFIVVSTFGVESVYILVSYVLILHSVLAIASREERLKSLNTCVSHICAVLIFYVPMVSVSMVHRFGKHAPEYVHKFMSLVYLFCASNAQSNHLFH